MEHKKMDFMFNTIDELDSATPAQAIAMGLNHWGCAMAGANNMPKDFGEFLVKVGEVSGVSPATGENLMKAAGPIVRKSKLTKALNRFKFWQRRD